MMPPQRQSHATQKSPFQQHLFLVLPPAASNLCCEFRVPCCMAGEQVDCWDPQGLDYGEILLKRAAINTDYTSESWGKPVE